MQYDSRNHRRILVIDGRIGFTGGYGISDDWLGDGRTPEHWRDTNVRVEGPAVKDLQAAFTDSWLETTGNDTAAANFFRVSRSEGPRVASIRQKLAGRRQLELPALFAVDRLGEKIDPDPVNPYFIPDERMTQALLDAAARKVRVIVLVPGKIDFKITYRASRRHYSQDVARRNPNLPIFAGALAFQDDGGGRRGRTMGGTLSFDNRSFALNEELNLTLYDRPLWRKVSRQSSPKTCGTPAKSPMRNGMRAA